MREKQSQQPNLNHSTAPPASAHPQENNIGGSSSPLSSISTAPSPLPPSTPPPNDPHASLSSLKTMAQQVIDRAGLEMPQSDANRGKLPKNSEDNLFFCVLYTLEYSQTLLSLRQSLLV